MKIEFTLEEVEVLNDCLIWKEIEEGTWIRKTEDATDELNRSIYKSSCREVAVIKAIMNKIEEARHTI